MITSPGEVDLPYFRLGMDKTPFIIVICSIAVVIVCAVAGCYFGMSRLSISEAEQRVVKAEEKVQVRRCVLLLLLYCFCCYR